MNLACPPVYTSSWLTAALWRSQTHTCRKELNVKTGNIHVNRSKHQTCWKWKVKNLYLVKRALRALRRPHTARPSVSLTQRSTAALARPNSLPTEWVNSSTQSITSPCSWREERMCSGTRLESDKNDNSINSYVCIFVGWLTKGTALIWMRRCASSRSPYCSW